jgi:subfamily B ATP-binding cassette protein MsbA
MLAYARPYVAHILVALALTLVSSSAEFGRAYLMKPLLDDVVLPQGAASASQELQRWAARVVPGIDAPLQTEAAEAPDAATLEAERLTAERVRRGLHLVLLAGGIVMLVLPLASFGREYVAAWALGRMDLDMKRDVCAKLLALPLRFHPPQRRGDVYSRAVNDVGLAHSALGLLFGDVVQSVVQIVVGVGFLFYVSWQLALISVLVGPTIFGVIHYFGRRVKRTSRARQEQYAEVTQRLLEILSGIKVIKAFRAEASENDAYRRSTHTLFRRSMRVVKNRLMARSLVDFMNHLVTYGAFLVGIGVMGWWQISIGELVAFFFISSQAYRPVRKLARAWVRMMDAEAGAQRLFELMDSPVDLRDAPGALDLPRVSRSIALRNVWFQYDEEPVLRDVSFEARAGEVVAIVGRTGAGKTTLADLLLRFYDPTSGSVEFDGIDLRRVTRDSLLGQIAVVTQEPFLFDGSIRENLRYGRPDASDAEVLNAARAAHVDDFVRNLSHGYDTEVGSSGARLSGGERQRITIGRAILKDPSILILDEATSALDSKSEKLVQEAIDSLLSGGRTVFVIAHRLSTVRRADRILVIEDGCISQQGSHDDLLARGGLYRELVKLQESASA